MHVLSGDSGYLSVGKHRAASVRIRHQQGEYCYDADSAHPGRGDSPEQYALGQALDIAQYGGSGGGESRYALEKGIHRGELPAVHYVRQHSEKAAQHPGTDHYPVALLLAYAGLSLHENQREALYLLGDIWDFWYEYRDVVPKGYVRVFGALADLMDRGVKVYFFQGNHDVWTYSYFEELGR